MSGSSGTHDLWAAGVAHGAVRSLFTYLAANSCRASGSTTANKEQIFL